MWQEPGGGSARAEPGTGRHRRSPLWACSASVVPQAVRLNRSLQPLATGPALVSAVGAKTANGSVRGGRAQGLRTRYRASQSASPGGLTARSALLAHTRAARPSTRGRVALSAAVQRSQRLPCPAATAKARSSRLSPARPGRRAPRPVARDPGARARGDVLDVSDPCAGALSTVAARRRSCSGPTVRLLGLSLLPDRIGRPWSSRGHAARSRRGLPATI